MGIKTQYLGIACLIPNDNMLEYSIGIIDKEAQGIFGKRGFKKMDNVLENDTYQVVYLIQKPLLKNAASLREFFNKLNDFLEFTSDYNSYFFNEQEADKK